MAIDLGTLTFSIGKFSKFVAQLPIFLSVDALFNNRKYKLALRFGSQSQDYKSEMKKYK